MQPTAQQPTNILDALQYLGGNIAGNLPQVNMPSLNYTLPTAGDLDSQWQAFLTRASNDPDIINYYQQQLNKAQGDVNIAINQIENDYQTGVRNLQQNTQGNLESLAQTFKQEGQALQDTLNQRGIALTQDPNGKLNYAGGGQPATELQNLQNSQSLRKEAETRSMQQGLMGLSSSLQSNLTNQGQSLSNTAQNLSQQKQSDILNRANTYYGLYQNSQNVNASNAFNKQQLQATQNFSTPGTYTPTMQIPKGSSTTTSFGAPGQVTTGYQSNNNYLPYG